MKPRPNDYGYDGGLGVVEYIGLGLFVIVIIAIMALLGSVFAADLTLPNPELTPGEANPVLTQKKICGPGFRTGPFRNVPASLKRKVYALYHMENHKGACAGKEGCELDHEISLELGGANTVKNLWPEPYKGPWGAHKKDVLENRLHKLVCAGTLTLENAQNEISTDWIASWKKHVGSK